MPGQAFIDVAASDIDLTTNAEIDYYVLEAGNIGSKYNIKTLKLFYLFHHYVKMHLKLLQKGT